MKLAKNHLYVALITLAAAGWAIDTFIFDHGAGPASAAAAPGPLLAVPQPPGAPAAAPPAPHKALTLAERFASVPASAESPDLLADAFAPPQSWIAPPITVAAPVAAATRPAAPRIDTDAFRRAHKLTAVFVTGRATGTAVIDGAMVPLGHPFAGFTLSAITERTATLHADGCDIVLQLDVPAESAVNPLAPRSRD